MDDSSDTPVFKITIQRESPVKGGEPKFSMVPENFSLPGQSAPKIPIPLGANVCPTVATSPVFSVGTYTKCAVPNCNNYFDGQRSEFMGISYFPFPQDPDLRQEWITAISLPPDQNTDHLKVCSDHFMNKDFVSDFIEVEEGSGEAENNKSKAPENVELRPGVKPSVKLGAAIREAYEAKVKTYSHQKRKGGGKSGKFTGLENPLIDTANEVRSPANAPAASTSQIDPADGGSLSADDPDVPVITSIGTIRPYNKPQKEIDRERASRGNLVDVVEVEDEEDDMIEEMMEQETHKQNQKIQDKGPVTVLETNEEKETDHGLINVPALVKLPPRRTITGDSSSATAPIEAPEPATSSASTEVAPIVSDDVMPGTSNSLPEPPVKQPRPRRKRRTREEIRREQEEDEWEPSFWSKKTLVKEGYEFEPKRPKQTVPSKIPKIADTSDDDLLRELDEGFRIDEPIGGSPEKRRRPGPASRTSRPQYVPPTSEQSDGDPKASTSEDPPRNGAPEKDLEEVLADESLLVDWAFFKSLLPDLRRMSLQKRDELKAFMLDILNARIYEGKPITPDCRGPVNV